jgi:hypothetical protein
MQNRVLPRKIRGVMFISPVSQERSERADKASLLTASGMLLHAFPSMSVSSLREFPENCVYRHGGFNCFIKYLHRKLLTTNFSLMILKVLKTCISWICILKQ